MKMRSLLIFYFVFLFSASFFAYRKQIPSAFLLPFYIPQADSLCCISIFTESAGFHYFPGEGYLEGNFPEVLCR